MAGLIGGTVCSVLLQPLDLVKTRLQLVDGRGVSTLSMIGRVWRIEGPHALWAGTLPSTIRLAGGVGLYFFFLGEVQEAARQVLGSQLSGAAAAARDFSVGALSRAAAAVIFNPFTVLKTYAEMRRPGEATRDLGAALATLMEAQGVAGLFAGLGAVLLRDVPYSGFSLVALRNVQALCASVPVLSDAPLLGSAIAGAAAAGFATVLTQPADAVRTHILLQAQRKRHLTPLRAAWEVAEQRGFGALFAGALPRMTRRALQQAITWSILEAMVGSAGR